VAVLAALSLYMAALTYAHGGCNSKRCVQRVVQREAHAKWARVVREYGIARLRARMRCESGGSGGYRLATTGNSFWFAHQFEARAWVAAGGRMRHGRPVGVWTLQPSRLEQDYRAARWDQMHGGDPWPNCP
jgi:hypothetical protein